MPKDTKDYHARFPMEHSLVMYLVPKNKIKEKGKEVVGGRAIFGQSKKIDEKHIKQLFILALNAYVRDKLGYGINEKMTKKDLAKFHKEFDKLMLFISK